VNQSLRDLVLQWIAGDPDAEDRDTIQSLLDGTTRKNSIVRFDAPLTFGTAGLRGPVMAGPAGMNRYTVRRATQGVIAWLGEIGVDPDLGVVVGRDARHGSELFNHEVVSVLLGAGVKVYEMPRPLPTPLVAYCVKEIGAAAGIMVTASHNPPQDNGYKLYSSDGSQIIPPNDEIVERFANEATTPELGERTSSHHRWISPDLLARYHAHMTQRFAVSNSDLAITYTPLHGVGGATMMELFAEAGYRSVSPVAAQFEPDGALPHVAVPEPGGAGGPRSRDGPRRRGGIEPRDRERPRRRSPGRGRA
jgi:phosphomannomutase